MYLGELAERNEALNKSENYDCCFYCKTSFSFKTTRASHEVDTVDFASPPRMSVLELCTETTYVYGPSRVKKGFIVEVYMETGSRDRTIRTMERQRICGRRSTHRANQILTTELQNTVWFLYWYVQMARIGSRLRVDLDACTHKVCCASAHSFICRILPGSPQKR